MQPLEGIRVLDLTRLAPGPFCTMLLADMGADVIVVEEPPGVGRRFDGGAQSEHARAFNALGRNKRSIGLNLKDSKAQEAFLRLADKADVVVEGFRPGVVKRLGVDFETLSKRNPRIIFCSLSGYGQTGPYSSLVGHDINYISLGGALGAIGWPRTPPALPLHLIPHLARRRALLTGGAPPYSSYECADGKWLSIGCLEPWFWAELCKTMGCEQYIPEQMNREKYPEMFDYLKAKFKERIRDDWFEELRQHHICVPPGVRPPRPGRRRPQALRHPRCRPHSRPQTRRTHRRPPPRGWLHRRGHRGDAHRQRRGVGRR